MCFYFQITCFIYKIPAQTWNKPAVLYLCEVLFRISLTVKFMENVIEINFECIS